MREPVARARRLRPPRGLFVLLLGLGLMEILLIVALVVVFFGAKRIPLIARGVGQSIRNFRREVKGGGEVEDEGAQGEIRPGEREGPSR